METNATPAPANDSRPQKPKWHGPAVELLQMAGQITRRFLRRFRPRCSTRPKMGRSRTETWRDGEHR